MEKLKLKIELVPHKSWSQSLYMVLPRSVWNKLRKDVCAEYKNKCGICGAKGRLECHEIWKYNDQKHVQKLVGFIVLCHLCHSVKHIGRAGLVEVTNRGTPKEMKTYDFSLFDKAIEHFMKVNACNRNVFDKHFKKICTKYRERSQYEWKTDFGKYQNLLDNAK